MQYRELVSGSDNLSVLGYGCMRFPTKGGRIDVEKTEEQILYAIKEGVNYFDTAYPYHAGKSEVVLGQILNKHQLRKEVYIADKLPVFLVNKRESIDKFFQTQLKRLETDYIDYYLMHMLDSMQTWEKMKRLGIIEFIDEKKKSGAIRHIGFSFHGRPEEFIKILEDYPWDFCQIQYNYLDEYNQAGLAGLNAAYAKNIGVVVMEPLRGGNLAAKAPTKVIDLLNTYSEKRSPAYWALRWIWNHEAVSVVLSGMNVDEHIKENIEVASVTHPNSMSHEEINLIDQVKILYKELMKVPCTGCNYCMPCPFGVDIPGTFSDYNDRYFFGGRFSQFQYMGKSAGIIGGKKSGADLCTACGKCEKHCPQEIHIIDELKQAHKTLSIPVVRGGLKIVGAFMSLRKNKKK